MVSSPSRATLFLDGRPVGRTPLTLNLNPGKYHLEVRKKGFLTWTSYIFLPSRSELLLKVSLEQGRGRAGIESSRKVSVVREEAAVGGGGVGMLILRSNPSGAGVWMGKKFLGYTPLIANYPPGDYTLIFRKPGFRTVERRIALKRGEALKIKARLLRARMARPQRSETRREEIGGRTVQLIVLSTPRADVFLNGKKYGRTPLISAGLEAGKYTITIRRKGYRPYRSQIELREGEKLKLSVRLKKK